MWDHKREMKYDRWEPQLQIKVQQKEMECGKTEGKVSQEHTGTTSRQMAAWVQKSVPDSSILKK